MTRSNTRSAVSKKAIKDLRNSMHPMEKARIGILMPSLAVNLKSLAQVMENLENFSSLPKPQDMNAYLMGMIHRLVEIRQADGMEDDEGSELVVASTAKLFLDLVVFAQDYEIDLTGAIERVLHVTADITLGQ